MRGPLNRGHLKFPMSGVLSDFQTTGTATQKGLRSAFRQPLRCGFVTE